MFKRALGAREGHVINLVSYAQFLTEHRKVLINPRTRENLS